MKNRHGWNYFVTIWKCELFLSESQHSILSSFRSFSNISADFAARIKINDSFKIRMNRADEICHNISILEVRKFRNHRYLTKFTFFFGPRFMSYFYEENNWGHLIPTQGWCNFNPSGKRLRHFKASNKADLWYDNSIQTN